MSQRWRVSTAGQTSKGYTMSKTLNKTAILELLDENTHSLLTPGFVDQVNKAFGVSLTPYVHKADGHRNPKGLTLPNGASQASGLAAFELAPLLCRALGVQYQDALGRGFLVRNCTSALRAAGHG